MRAYFLLCNKEPSFVETTDGKRLCPPALRHSIPQSLRLYKINNDEDTEPFFIRVKCNNNLVKYFVYILECFDHSYYIGCTNNLERRIKQHNGSKCGAHYTKIRRPVILKYSEQFEALVEARCREAEIKGWRREKKEKLFS